VLTGSAILFDLPFEPIYAASAWIAWLVPLMLVWRYAERLDAWAFHRPPLASSRPIG
jgi:hypothetical protein